MSIPSRLTFTHIKNVILEANKIYKPIPLGRWGVKNNVNLAVYYSNVDHCGSCGEYLNNKQLDNKYYNNQEKLLKPDYLNIISNTPD